MADKPSGRIHSMDALRASTMFLLVPVHGAGMVWINGHTGAWAITIFWFVHVFRLPLFFAMSGFFLCLLLGRQDLAQTVRNRTVRIAAPLAIGLVTLIPLMLFAAQQTGTALTEQGRPPSGSPFSFEPGFLWFLWYLLIIDGVAIGAYVLSPRVVAAAGKAFRGLISRPLGGVALLAVPTVLALWPEPGWMAIADAETFVPDLPVLAYYGLFFALGATLCAHRDLVESIGSAAWRWVACALVAIVPAAALFTLHNSVRGEGTAVHAFALLAYAVATWTSVIALIGLANRYLTRARPRVRYIADSSYWIYLSHMPTMVLVVALVGATSLGTAPQFAIVTLGSLAISIATYPLLVRYTAIGRLLNGPRKRPAGPTGLRRRLTGRPRPERLTPPRAAAERRA